MTDNETIKAIEYCSSHDDCDLECPIGKETTEDEGCIRTIGRLALDIINRQKAEIKRLEKANESFSCMGKMYSEIKTEARKEFAERLKAKAEIVSCGDYGFVYEIGEDDIDNLLAEMEERK